MGGLLEIKKKSLTRLEQTISASGIMQTGIKDSAAVLVTTNTYNKAIALILFSPSDTIPNIAFNSTSSFGTNEISIFYVYIEDGELRIKNNHIGSTIFRIVKIQFVV